MNPKDVMKIERSETSPERVESIVKRAHREVATKDLIEFGGARIWLALLSILGLFVAFVGRSRTDKSDDETASRKNQVDREAMQ